MKSSVIHIGERAVGPGEPCWIVAEVGLAHEGSLGQAQAFIDAAAACGVDAVKFQTHIAAAESTLREAFRVPFSRQDKTRYDYWERTAFDQHEWSILAAYAAERNVIFFSSPFSVEAVELLQSLDVPAWKIGSGEVANTVLLDAVARTGKPVLLSSGMSSWQELDQAVHGVRRHDAPLLVYQCTSRYPVEPAEAGLNVLQELRERYQCPVGYSDHSGDMYAGLAAATLGADSVEVHLTLSERSFGPDVKASLTPDQLRQLVEGIRTVEQALAQPVDKDRKAAELSDMQALFHHSIVARQALPAGHVLTEQDLAVKKPGDGLPPSRMPDVVGKLLCCDVQADGLITEDMLKPS